MRLDDGVCGGDGANEAERSGDVPAPPSLALSRADMLAVIAHELRQPLAAALTATEFVADLVAEGASGELIRRNVHLAGRCMRESLRLADDLLTLGRADAGVLRLRRAPVDVLALLEETRARVARVARARRVDVRVEARPDLPHPAADPDRLMQVLTNVCGNAVKFTPPGGCIELSAAAGPDALCVEVTDSGPGVSAAELAHLFEPHWQGSGTCAGAGLGLSIAKWLVEAHGGRIAARPALRGGLTVAFTIPMSGDAAAATA